MDKKVLFLADGKQEEFIQDVRRELYEYGFLYEDMWVSFHHNPYLDWDSVDLAVLVGRQEPVFNGSEDDYFQFLRVASDVGTKVASACLPYPLPERIRKRKLDYRFIAHRNNPSGLAEEIARKLGKADEINQDRIEEGYLFIGPEKAQGFMRLLRTYCNRACDSEILTEVSRYDIREIGNYRGILIVSSWKSPFSNNRELYNYFLEKVENEGCRVVALMPYGTTLPQEGRGITGIIPSGHRDNSSFVRRTGLEISCDIDDYFGVE
ncbi:MAG: hypothetical protein ABIH72_02360 [archaeon]